jgi:heptaprenylglyceryl phosphate synthase
MAVQAGNNAYKMYTRDAVAGALYGTSLTNSTRLSFINSEATGIGFGVAVQRSTPADMERNCKLGTGLAESGAVLGFAMRQINKTQEIYSTTGDISYGKGEAVGVLTDGYLNVELKGAAAAVAGAKAFVHPTTGAVSAEATGGYLEATNVSFELGGATGDIVVINITRATQA